MILHCKSLAILHNSRKTELLSRWHSPHSGVVTMTLLPSKDLILEACSGAIHEPHPILLAAYELASLHEARSTADSGYTAEIDCCRARLVHEIDRWIAGATPDPAAAAFLHTETIGTVVDRLAELSVAAHAALRPEFTDLELQTAWHRLAPPGRTHNRIHRPRLRSLLGPPPPARPPRATPEHPMTALLLPFLTGAATAALCAWLLHHLPTLPKPAHSNTFPQSRCTVATITARLERESRSATTRPRPSSTPAIHRRSHRPSP
ncbi:DUF4254 domain-containing protein [Nocardia seriolae]|nr:DUF4254 domain-containing protein [Nocardia seriolae]WNJ62809.1 DUF4254 domain-containing protein [Nocardia seriolae]